MDDVRDISKKIKQQEKEIENLQWSVGNLRSENEKQQREINNLYCGGILLAASSIIAALNIASR
ncbi:MAG: hypothetical protein HFI72_07330 [Peptococcaceae bacterium]|nr:hypothetical protein [Peptococcaceae bacterium]